jgi:hypothetical protein
VIHAYLKDVTYCEIVVPVDISEVAVRNSVTTLVAEFRHQLDNQETMAKDLGDVRLALVRSEASLARLESLFQTSVNIDGIIHPTPRTARENDTHQNLCNVIIGDARNNMRKKIVKHQNRKRKAPLPYRCGDAGASSSTDDAEEMDFHSKIYSLIDSDDEESHMFRTQYIPCPRRSGLVKLEPDPEYLVQGTPVPPAAL